MINSGCRSLSRYESAGIQVLICIPITLTNQKVISFDESISSHNRQDVVMEAHMAWAFMVCIPITEAHGADHLQ